MTAMNTQLATKGALAGQMAQAVLEMLETAQRVLRADPGQAKSLLDRASVLLTPAAPSLKALDPSALSGLAPWQERKVDQFIAENLDRTIGVGELAALARLSTTHFSRVFKRSFGVTPRDYVMRARLERAKALLSRTSLSLCQIALDCGFCDQAHMSRIFHQVVGATPSRWRKQTMFEMAA
jgi:transcriptional regulator GlxA family with amidase domain